MSETRKMYMSKRQKRTLTKDEIQDAEPSEVEPDLRGGFQKQLEDLSPNPFQTELLDGLKLEQVAVLQVVLPPDAEPGEGARQDQRDVGFVDAAVDADLGAEEGQRAVLPLADQAQVTAGQDAASQQVHKEGE